MEIFEHGGKIELFAQELSCNTNEIIDLSSNINFIKPHIDIDFSTINISSYPTYTQLYDSLSNKYNINGKQIELYNGGSSAIFSLFAYLKKEHCTIYSPAYLEYKKAAIIYNYEYDLINRFTQINRAVKENSLVIFVNPSTPDGQYYDIENYIKAWHNLTCTILIDESFIDFTNYKSALMYIKKYENLYILKSMTKFYSCAGVRCGIIVSNEKNIKKLSKNEPLWKISQYDSSYLQKALKDKIFNKTAKAINIHNSLILEKLLKNYSFIQKVFPSNTNFLLIKLKNLNANIFQNHLKKYKIMIRDCSNFDFLDNSYVRIAVKNEKSIKTLKIAFDDLNSNIN
jgi:threonine-phosphate decarboxylase